MNANTFKEKIDKVLTEAIEINQQQIVGGSAEDFATYRYMVGVGQTLADMKDRFHQEYVKMIKQETGEQNEEKEE